MIPLEIERKFLIRNNEETEKNIVSRTDIRQIYLKRTSPEIQRRVRSMCTDGNTVYYYTEKKFISAAVREENEKTISADEFEALLAEADNELAPVIKTRSILIYLNQRFEIDSYPFEDKLEVMELELSSEAQEIFLPPYVDIVKEITGISEYSNANLALNGRFPEIKDEKS